MSEAEPFNKTVLPDISPFTVDWSNITKRDIVFKDGSKGVSYLLHIVHKALPFLVEVYKTDYDRLRVLNILGIKDFTATWGMAKREGDRAPIILSGSNRIP